MSAVLRRTIGPLVCLTLFMGATACEVAKSSSPLSPTIAGPIEGVSITPPKGLEPAANQQIKDKDQPFNVVIENSTTTSPRPFKMRMQIAADGNFSSVVWSREGIEPGGNGQTRFTMPDRLQAGRQYYWRAMADDGANQSPWSDVVGFQVLMPSAFGAPGPRSPVGNEQVSSNRPELRVANGSSQGPVGQPYYLFQVATNSSFSALVVSEETPQQGDETRLTVPAPLAHNTTYYWRVRISDGETVGPWSQTETFRTGAAPAPPPGPGPSPAPGGSCVLSSGQAILECNRSRYGHMSSSEIVAFLTQSARDLNAAGISGNPFGLLVKPGGHNCNGYSCDILCAGNGSGQRQWDVLLDSEGAQIPVWSEVDPHEVFVRPCVIQ